MTQGKRVSGAIPEAARTALQAIGRAVRRARLAQGEGQAVAAGRLGVHVQTIGRIEAGEPGVAAGHVLGLMAVYGLGQQLQALAADEETGTPPPAA